MILIGLLVILAINVTAIILVIRDRDTDQSGKKQSSEDLESAQLPDEDDGRNSGFYSMMGTAMHLNNHTYFVQAGIDNDCEENGSEYSEGIWRISDEIDAEPELVYSVPANMIDGTAQNTVCYMTGSGDKIWYFRAENGSSTDYSLNWVNAEGTESGTVELPEHDWISKVDYDNGSYIIIYTVTNEEKETSTHLWNFDTETETGEEMDIPTDQQDDSMEFLYAGNGFIYFIQGTAEEHSTNTLYRRGLNSDEYEMIGEIPSAALEDPLYSFFYAAEEYFYYLSDNLLSAISLESGQVKIVLDGTELLNTMYPTWCITDKGIWYQTEAGIMHCDPDGSNKVQTGITAVKDSCGLFLSGSWLFSSQDGSPVYSRTETVRPAPAEAESDSDEALEENTAEIRPLVESNTDTLILEQEDDLWIYTVYPAFIEINGYKGEEETVTIPEELAGLPVRRINCSDENSFTGTKALILPEALITIEYICIPGLESVQLREFAAFFGARGFVKSFDTGTRLKLIFNGTLKQWKKLCKKSNRYYGFYADEDWGTSYVIDCTDGEYDYNVSDKKYKEQEVIEEQPEEEVKQEVVQEEPALQPVLSYDTISSMTYSFYTGTAALNSSGNINVNADGSFSGNYSASFNGYNPSTGAYSGEGTFSYFYGKLSALEYVDGTTCRAYVTSLVIDTPTGSSEDISGYQVTYGDPAYIGMGDEILFYLPETAGDVMHNYNVYAYATSDGYPAYGSPVGTYVIADVTHSYALEGRERRDIWTKWSAY